MEINIKSKRHGTYTIYFDIEDLDKIKVHTWHIARGGNTLYAVTNILAGSKKTLLGMHRLIMSPDANMVIDHKDGNGLNNRKSNLRICSNAENARNRIMPCDNSTGFKGVHFHYSETLPFRSRIRVDGKLLHLGLFNTAIEAAKAYNMAAKKYFGKFARLNKV